MQHQQHPAGHVVKYCQVALDQSLQARFREGDYTSLDTKSQKTHLLVCLHMTPFGSAATQRLAASKQELFHSADELPTMFCLVSKGADDSYR